MLSIDRLVELAAYLVLFVTAVRTGWIAVRRRDPHDFDIFLVTGSLAALLVVQAPRSTGRARTRPRDSSRASSC